MLKDFLKRKKDQPKKDLGIRANIRCEETYCLEQCYYSENHPGKHMTVLQDGKYWW